MKVSITWLQKYFATPLPSVDTLAHELTFHAAEIEEASGDLLDVNVLPDRAAYMLSHRGVAKELSAVLNIPLATDPLKEELASFPETDQVSVSLDEEGKCARYIGARITGVTVGPSPEWLKDALESVGQRSINNVVDATNYVMLDIGQPLHAFDASKLTKREDRYAITVRASSEGESITTLTGEDYDLPEGTLLVADANADGLALGIAGVKGGIHAAVTEGTTDLIIEAASFDGAQVRKTAQALKLFTDASSRFQNKPSPALAGYGIAQAIELIQKVAGGEIVGVTDVYPNPPESQTASVSLEKINGVLGSTFSVEDVRGAFDRLGFSYTEVEDRFIVLAPFERADITIAEDLVEEVGRILGYDQINSSELPLLDGIPSQERFRGIEAVRDFLVERGFSEISTPSFASEGEIELANPLQSDRPYLRASLIANLKDALVRAAGVAPRVLGPAPFVKLFEVGTVFTKQGEALLLSMGVVAVAGKPAQAAEVLKENVAALEQDLLQIPGAAHFTLDGQMMELNLGKRNLEKLGEEYAPVTVQQGTFKPYSLYPSALRDIAVWTPEGTQESEVASAIIAHAGEHLARIDLFDQFEKDGRTSYAFRLVFESNERTLADTDLDPAMERVTDSLNKKEGWEVR
ncbi:MAG: phenylalanine--tRNA ligase subunit beta [bacterium]|nr:phenylalanine--tRNA ligase subunit beta [bacterium]